MKTRLILPAIACLALLPPPATQAAERLSEAREAVSQWVAAERTLSREAAAWREKRANLNDLISVARKEIESLQVQIADSKETATVADTRRADLVEKQERLSKTTAAIAAFLKPTESRLRELKKRLPAPLQEKLASHYKRLPSNAGTTSLGLAERMQTVVGILTEIQKFDTVVTVVENVRKLNDGTSGEVRTIWFGLGAAYYVSAGGKDAGVGEPNAEGWTWKSQPELAEAILEVFNAAEGRARETGFTPLPVNVSVAR